MASCRVFFGLFAIIASLYVTYGLVTLAPTLKMNDGREIPALALGTWLGNSSKGRIDASEHSEEVSQAIASAIGAGYRHVDTAHVYGTEAAVGRGAKAGGVAREDLFITTKLWNSAHPRSSVVPALRHSLQQLGMDHVDLYLVHWPLGQFENGTYDFTDYLETWRGMMEAKALGLTRSIGLSNFNQQMMDRIIDSGLEMPAVLQVEINLNLQQPELLAYCKAKNIIVMGYTPFGSLFGSKGSADAPPPRVDEPTLVAIANKYNKTVPQVALRYLVELGVVPIPKALTLPHILKNLDIFDFQLSAEDREQLKSYDRNYRTVAQLKWLDHPYYPFEKKQ